MSKVLYISDLDGTLLNKSQCVSQYTADTLNRYIDKGLIFSYATARSNVTASKVTSAITKSIPVIVYNGCFIMNSLTGEILSANYFLEREYNSILNDLNKVDIHPIVYSYIDSKEKFSYKKSKINIPTQEFISTRSGDLRDNPVEDLSFLAVDKPFYITCISNKELLLPIFNKYKDMFSCVFHKDIYSHEQWLEIMPPNVNKANEKSN